MSSLPSGFNQDIRADRRNRKLASRLALATDSLLYQCPQGKSATVTSIFAANVTESSGDFYLYHVTPSETVALQTAIMHHIAIAGRSVLLLEATVYLTSGDRLVFSATQSTCATVYGSES